MNPKIKADLSNLVNKLASPEIKEKFINRIDQFCFSRDENLESHFCCYFAAIDPKTKKVFIGLHKKSDLWLFNGGHMDKRELPKQSVLREMTEEWGYIPININNVFPSLLTITNINHPIIKCKTHFDIWYFIKVDIKTFKPDDSLLQTEFYETKWVTVQEARKICQDSNTNLALTFIEENIFKKNETR